MGAEMVTVKFTANTQWNDANPGWSSIGIMKDDSPPYASGGIIGKSDLYAAPYLGTVADAPWLKFGDSDPQPIPDALCPNCRRDRHDFPLSERVAEMWKSLAFTDYDPADDVSRIVCPGSDVCGPALAQPNRWTINALQSLKGWGMAMAPADITQWTYESASGYATDIYAFDEALSMAAYTWLPEEKLPEAFAPVPQAAIEAAPKQLEHLAPQSPGFDFTEFKTDPLYPGKKKYK